jgi:hypothetical protein
MSGATFNPNQFTVEELFCAKEEHRRRLARLPFEEKIKIVEKLQAGVLAATKNERLIFDSFIKASPDFAGEPVEEWDGVEEWYAKRALATPPHPFDKRPDIIARTASGKMIGVELKSWVSRQQITEARKQERIQDNILKAIGAQPRNDSQHIGVVWLSAKQIRFDPGDAVHFRAQLFDLIEQVDKSWTQKPKLDQNSWQDIKDFSAFTILEKYLDSSRFHPASRRFRNIRWILFPSPGGHYSPNEMRETLKTAVLAHKSDERYKDLRVQAGLDEVYLLVHYDFKAFAYNTPYAAPGFGFKEAAEFASGVLEGDGGYFDRVFLFHFLWGKEEAYRII